MAGTSRDADLRSRESRRRLGVGHRLHVMTLPTAVGTHALGWKRTAASRPGVWSLRSYTGNPSNPYRHERIGLADDMPEVEGLPWAEADRRAREMVGASARRSPLTVSDAVADYVEFLRAERKTGDEAEQRAASHIIPELGSYRVSDLTTEQLMRWRNGLVAGGGLVRGRRRQREAPATPDARRARQATANRTMTILKAALNRAFRQGIVNDDLAWRRLEAFKDVHAARPGHLTVEEAQRLINAADKASGFRDLVHAALLSGCRYGELTRLRVRDYGRGRLAILESKTGRPRDVVLTEEAEAFFAGLCAGRARDEYLLRNLGRVERSDDETDPGDWRKSEQTRPMLEACRAASIVPAIGFHGLRHTWASLSVMGGMPLILVARNLGHTDTRMVERHYGHLVEDFVTTEIRKSAPRFGAVPPSPVVPLVRAS